MPVDYISLSNAKSRGKRPDFLGDQTSERLLSMLLATVQELAVTRERLDTIERIMESKGQLSKAEIDAFRPDGDAAHERGVAHRELIGRVTRAVQQEMEGMKMDEKAPAELMDEFSRD